MFGREPVVRDKGIGAGAQGNLAHETGKRLRRAEHIASAVNIEQARARLCTRRPNPEAGNTADRPGLDPNIRRSGRGSKHAVEHRPGLRAHACALMGRRSLSHRGDRGSIFRREGLDRDHGRSPVLRGKVRVQFFAHWAAASLAKAA